MDTIQMIAPIGSTKPAFKISSAGSAGGESFGDVLAKALDTVNQSQAEAGRLSRRFNLGDPTVSLEETMIAGAKSNVQFQALIQVRNRVVQEYTSIMNMQI